MSTAANKPIKNDRSLAGVFRISNSKSFLQKVKCEAHSQTKAKKILVPRTNLMGVLSRLLALWNTVLLKVYKGRRRL